jgi:hypothetical protein
MDTQAKRLLSKYPERTVKSYRISLDGPTIRRLVNLENETQIRGEVWLQAGLLALLSTFETRGHLQLPLSVVPRGRTSGERTQAKGSCPVRIYASA